MFRKILIVAMFATAAGYCFAAETVVPQVVTSQVVYNTENVQTEDISYSENTQVQQVKEVPVWPIAGSDADVNISQDKLPDNNVKIVSKIGADLVVENNINLGGNRGGFWSGGANMLHGEQLPAGFYDDCNTEAEMPLLNREMLEDDGGSVLTVSRSSRRNCGGTYLGTAVSGVDKETAAADESNKSEIAVDESADAEASAEVKDQVRSWVVANGQTLREVLQTWCDKEGWDLVWTTSREYPIEASAVFKGRFVDVSSALVRNFSRAMPIPYAKFYNGNRVLVISTVEE